MSQSKPENEPAVPAIPENANRGEVLDLLEDAINETHRKIESGRVYDPENEKVRQGWMRVLGYLAGQYRQLLKDKDLDELAERIEALEEDQ
ncbi:MULTISPECIES: hypothetical protein [Haloferax]|uniref:DUF8136 domain-containing protein n=1 Tax=Haloferax massiliensis TaxID=1476858 RepID=A0A0D6JMW2_9EURY|nr:MULTISPECIES: hypothetical protein [Haloferax]RDZ41330.1 hypothetical protein C5B89_05090 [Haloferax sp. Atlit-47N]CQR49236.1 hypothetical protein BN996_00693 [Haloferax massiliensis]